MTTRKIADLPKHCRHPSHKPAGHIVRPPGVYEHECPGCGRKLRFVVSGAYWGTPPPSSRLKIWSVPIRSKL